MKILPAVITLGLLFAILPARAGTIFDFSFSNSEGKVSGTVTGTITLPDICPVSCAATGATVTSFPAGLNSVFGAAPIDVFSLFSGHALNSFTVTGGAITAISFFIYSPSNVGSPASFLDFNGTLNALELDQLNGVTNNTVLNSGGLAGVSFTKEGSGSVPEPGTWETLALGLTGLVGLCIRRHSR